MRFILTESVMSHILADIDQIVTEFELNPLQHTPRKWMAMIRHAVDGEDYKC